MFQTCIFQGVSILNYEAFRGAMPQKQEASQLGYEYERKPWRRRTAATA